MRVIFQKNSKKRAKKKMLKNGKITKNLGKMYTIWKYFEEVCAIIACNKLLEKALSTSSKI